VSVIIVNSGSPTSRFARLRFVMHLRAGLVKLFVSGSFDFVVTDSWNLGDLSWNSISHRARGVLLDS
jgi:hypothetical protein